MTTMTMIVVDRNLMRENQLPSTDQLAFKEMTNELQNISIKVLNTGQ